MKYCGLLTDHNGQIFIVDYSLHLGNDNTTGVLIVEFRRLAGRHDVQIIPDSVVFANP